MMRIKIASREKGREISVFDQEVGWQDVRGILAQSLDRCESNCRCYNGIVWSNYAVPRCLRTPRCLRNSRDPRVINSNYPVLFLTSYQVYTYTVPLTIVKSSQWNKTEGSSIPRTPSLNEPPISSRFSLISRPIKRTNVKPDYLSIMCLTPLQFSLFLEQRT